MGLPPNHPFIDWDFPEQKPSIGGYPHDELEPGWTPPQICSMDSKSPGPSLSSSDVTARGHGFVPLDPAGRMALLMNAMMTYPFQDTSI